MIPRKSFFSPGRIIFFSFALTIIIGTTLLSLPFCQRVSVSLLDCLFTAVSATCVTGLLTVPLNSFTGTGHMVLLGLIQVGALGLVTLTIFMMSLFVELGMGTQFIAGEVLEIGHWQRSRNMLWFIIGFTLCVETIGTGAVYYAIKDCYPQDVSFFYALFHTISSFSNAGITLLSPNSTVLPSCPGLLAITALLVIMGGLGFLIWHEIGMYLGSFREKRHFHWTLHSKIVASMTASIIALTTTVILSLEYLRLYPQWGIIRIAGEALFNAICCRSTGFTTLDLQTVHFATIFFIMIVAFIGSSPGSTGSGIKTTTFALFLAAIKAVIMRRSIVEIKGRSIPNDQIFKAMAILTLSLTWIAISIFFLLLSEQGWRFVDVVFESVSAFANLGLTTGETCDLSSAGKGIIMVSMLVGRIGTLTLLLAFKSPREKAEFHYPEERVIIS